jgi:dTDP-4-amino-4,6-dideoxygalactose transaminase
VIPLVDLSWQHAVIAGEVEKGLASLFERSAYILGDEVETFERAYASFEGAAHCIGASSGTDALELALRALDIGPGDEVIVPAMTFVATALAVLRSGATVVLADVDPSTLLLTAEQAAPVMTGRTRAIVPVHLYGQMAPVEELEHLGVPVLEDAAQSQGAARLGRRMGVRVAATSFYPGKNLGAYGDAGAVLTNDASVAGRVRALRNYGSSEKYVHTEIGFNARLDTVQAVVLLAKLQHLAAWNALRREAAARYRELRLEPVPTLEGNEHVYHLFVVRVPERDRALARLHEAGIGAGVHYPVPIHLQPAFGHLGLQEGAFPNAEQAAREILSLPMFPGITAEQQEQVARALARG